MKKIAAKKKRAIKAAAKVAPKKASKAIAVAAEHGMLSDAMRLWVSKNRNMQTEIAGKANCSPQFVNMVIKGVRKHERVERLLREAGAPING